MTERTYSDNSLSMHLQEIGQYPLLSSEEARVLGREVQRGLVAQRLIPEVSADMGMELYVDMELAIERGQRAETQFVTSNLRLVVPIARRRARGDPEKLLENIQSGSIGLVKAVRGFNPKLGFEFSTYAYPKIKSAMQKVEEEEHKNVGIAADDAQRLKSLTAHETYDDGTQRTDDELCENLGISRDKLNELRFLQHALKTASSLDAPLPGEGDFDRADLVADHASESQYTAVDNQLAGILRPELMQNLSPRMIRIMELRFGYDGKTQDEVARELGIAPPTVRLDEKRAFAIIRNTAEDLGIGYSQISRSSDDIAS